MRRLEIASIFANGILGGAKLGHELTDYYVNGAVKDITILVESIRARGKRAKFERLAGKICTGLVDSSQVGLGILVGYKLAQGSV
jgi:hypothetical protein